MYFKSILAQAKNLHFLSVIIILYCRVTTYQLPYEKFIYASSQQHQKQAAKQKQQKKKSIEAIKKSCREVEQKELSYFHTKNCPPRRDIEYLHD